MARGKNKARIKKRTSKHVLAAQERRSKEDETPGTTATPLSTSPMQPTAVAAVSSNKKKSSKYKIHEKDPTEVHAYLSSWKNRHLGNDIWKFNKNTQSWLLRHMYDADKVKKETFTLLTLYIVESPKDGGFKLRILEDAQRRARRYMEWEKKKEQPQQNPADAGQKKETIPPPSNTSKEKDDPKNLQNLTVKDAKNQEDIDEKRWETLDAHDKRKEYKRARKIMEALSAEDLI